MDKKSENSGHIEKRKYPRLPIKINFFCHNPVPKEGDGLLYFNSRDLSCGGVYLQGDISLNPGSILHMDFKMPNIDKLISVSGVVIRKDTTGLAIRFLTLNIDEFELVENFITSQME
jgi:hypothetical protein